MSKKKFRLTLYQLLFILLASWFYTVLTYYLPFGDNVYSLSEIYTFQGIPFALMLGVFLNYCDKL